MIDGQTLMQERESIKKSLNHSMDKMYKNGIDYAEKTREYRLRLAQAILLLRNQGVQISIIDKIAKGQEQIAELEFEMLKAEVLYKSSQENIMIQKKLFDSIEADIAREYNRTT